MVRLTKALISFLICLQIMMCGFPAFASSKNLPENFCVDDENGISVGEEGEYFMYADNLLPGDVITRTLTLRNLEQDVPYTLHMVGEPKETTGPVNWLDNLHLQIILNGREIYAGRLRGDGKDTRTMKGNGIDMLNDKLDLGVYNMGDYGILNFIVTADAGHLATEDFYKASEARIVWTFTAVKDVSPNPPKTGEIIYNTLYVFLLLIIILCAVFYNRYRKLRACVSVSKL